MNRWGLRDLRRRKQLDAAPLTTETQRNAETHRDRTQLTHSTVGRGESAHAQTSQPPTHDSAARVRSPHTPREARGPTDRTSAVRLCASPCPPRLCGERGSNSNSRRLSFKCWTAPRSSRARGTREAIAYQNRRTPY